MTKELGFPGLGMEEVEKLSIRQDCKDELFLLRITAYQQLQF